VTREPLRVGVLEVVVHAARAHQPGLQSGPGRDELHGQQDQGARGRDAAARHERRAPTRPCPCRASCAPRARSSRDPTADPTPR
jgi:hypothetical protein